VKRGDMYRVAHPSMRDPKKFRVFVVVSRQAVIDSRFSTVVLIAERLHPTFAPPAENRVSPDGSSALTAVTDLNRRRPPPSNHNDRDNGL